MTTSASLRAYHGDPTQKDFYLNRVRQHREKDELVRGTGWAQMSDGVYRGCAVGCTLEEYSHAKYEPLLGVWQILARLQEQIFERLPHEDALAFPEQFLSAIPVGADLLLVWPKVALWVLTDEQHGVLRHAQGDRHKQQREAIERVVALYKSWAASESIAASEWRAARSAAYAAAYAADAADADDADDADDAYADARTAFWRALRDRLLAELAAAPVTP